MIEFTEAELVILEWHSALLDEGMGLDEALKHIEDSVPQPGAVTKVLRADGGKFAHYLRKGLADLTRRISESESV